jgi:uncharacterized circularly permuted ATP-grasp superfamily protein
MMVIPFGVFYHDLRVEIRTAAGFKEISVITVRVDDELVRGRGHGTAEVGDDR